MFDAPQTLNDFAGLCLRTSMDAVWIGLAALALSFTRLWTPRMRLFVVGLALVRLMVPVVPEVSFHPGSWLPESRDYAGGVATEVGFVSEDAAVLTSTGSIVAAELGVQSAASRQAWLKGLAAVWIIGVALTLAWLAGSQLALTRRMRLVAPVHDPRLRALLDEAAHELGMGMPPPLVRASDWGLIALVGAVKPRLVITDDFAERFNETEALTIFKHELAHLKRRDLAWNWLFTLICAAHWFNPMAWLLFHRWRTDVELRCDEIALRGAAEEERHRYGHALVSMLQTLNTPGPSASVAPLFHRKLNLKHRMKMIVNPSRYSPFTHAVAVLFVGVLAALSLTQAKADGESPNRQNGPREGQRQIRPGVQREGDRAPRPGVQREGDRAPRPGVRREGDATPRPGVRREGDRMVRPSMLRDGEGAPRPGVLRDGEGMPRPGVRRDGEGAPRPGMRDGEGAPRPGVIRDGEGPARQGPRDGGGISREGQARQQGIMIRVNARGQVIAGNNRPVPIETVRATLKKLAGSANGRPIVIKADQGMPTASLKALIHECEKAGVKNVSFSGTAR